MDSPNKATSSERACASILIRRLHLRTSQQCIWNISAPLVCTQLHCGMDTLAIKEGELLTYLKAGIFGDVKI